MTMIPTWVNVINIIKSIGIICGTLGAIYGSMWAIGIAPISNLQAQSMVNEAVKKESQRIYDKIEGVEDVIQEAQSDISGQGILLGRVDERTKRSIALQNIILQELRNIRTQ